MQKIFRRTVALPQDHGSWVFLFSPLLIGLFAAGDVTEATPALLVGAVSAFLLRQPITIAVKTYSGRRPQSEQSAAWFWIFVYGTAGLASLVALVLGGNGYVTWLAVPALPVFVWHLWLVSKRAERRQAGVEVVATGALALAAPAAFWVGKGGYDPQGWILWVFTWLQSAASIVYAYLRLQQREWRKTPPLRERWQAAQRALTYAGFNLSLVLVAAIVRQVAPWLWLAPLIQMAETTWGSLNPAQGAKPVSIGVRQLLVSSIYTIVFILLWR